MRRRHRDVSNELYLVMYLGGLALCIIGCVLLAKSNPPKPQPIQVEVVR